MTAYAREIEDIVQSKNPSSIETMPKGTRYITLLYHQVSQADCKIEGKELAES
jgi:hypothetical protein